MQFTTLFTLLTLLSTPLLIDARAAHQPKRQLAQHAKHARNAENVAANVDRREQLAATNPRALNERPIRKVQKRGAAGCRVKGSNVTLTSTSQSTTAAAAGTSSVTIVGAAVQTTATSAAAMSSAAGNAGVAVGGDAAYGGGGGAVTTTSTEAAATPSAAPAATSAVTKTGNSVGVAGTPWGIKAGGSGSDTLAAYGSHTSWWFNYGSVPDGSGAQTFIPMVWGNGNQGNQDWSRLDNFKKMTQAPQYIFGFYEPDCLAPMSSDIDPGVAAALWLSTIAPWRSQGSALISPGPCKQKDETWLEPFLNAIGHDNMWDYTQIHTNKNNLQGVKDDVEYYYAKYGKPVWVNEFACVDDQNGFTPCSDQGQINGFINDVVDYFEGDYRVVAYAMSEGEGLGDVWPPWRNGGLTESGQTYVNAISKYH